MPTPPISTYLIAFVIANYEKVGTKSSKNITIEVAGRPQAILNNEGDFALKDAAVIIDFFDEYFNVPYPLDKSSKLHITIAR